jgi:hypothetical protein
LGGLNWDKRTSKKDVFERLKKKALRSREEREPKISHFERNTNEFG